MSNGALERLHGVRYFLRWVNQNNTWNVHSVGPTHVNFIENYVPIARQSRRENISHWFNWFNLVFFICDMHSPHDFRWKIIQSKMLNWICKHVLDDFICSLFASKCIFMRRTSFGFIFVAFHVFVQCYCVHNTKVPILSYRADRCAPFVDFVKKICGWRCHFPFAKLTH